MASCHTHAAIHNRDKEARRRKDSREEGGVGTAERKAAWVQQRGRRRGYSREEGGVGTAEKKAAWVWQDAIPS